MSSAPKRPSAPIKAKQTTGRAFGIILRYNFDSLNEWAPIAYLGEDIEGVHQARVSLRRMRSAVGLFRKAIPRELIDPWAIEMKWIASSMGAARDLDVFIDEGLKPMSGKIPLALGEQNLLALATQRRNEAYAELKTMMDGERYQIFMTDFPKWLDAKSWLKADQTEETKKQANKSIRLYAISTLNKRVRNTLAYGEKMGTMNSEELHQLRIECKKLRYAYEFFQPLFNPDEITNFSLHLKGLQSLLGVMNDVAVMPHLLEKILMGETNIDTLQFAGALIGWRARQYEEVRGQLDARWQEFAQTDRPWLA